MNSCLNYYGRLVHSFQRGIDSFFSIIFWYFYFFPFALKFCHGNDPLMKYSNTLAIPSISSLLPCSIPRCVLRDAYRAVPVRFLLSLQGIWPPSLVTQRLANPKSIRYIFLQNPIEETKRLAKFLDVDVTDELIAEITDKCSLILHLTNVLGATITSQNVFLA